MNISSTSIQSIINTRPDLITNKQYYVEQIINDMGETIIQKTALKAELVLDTVINESIGSIINVYV